MTRMASRAVVARWRANGLELLDVEHRRGRRAVVLAPAAERVLAHHDLVLVHERVRNEEVRVRLWRLRHLAHHRRRAVVGVELVLVDRDHRAVRVRAAGDDEEPRVVVPVARMGRHDRAVDRRVLANNDCSTVPVFIRIEVLREGRECGDADQHHDTCKDSPTHASSSVSFQSVSFLSDASSLVSDASFLSFPIH